MADDAEDDSLDGLFEHAEFNIDSLIEHAQFVIENSFALSFAVTVPVDSFDADLLVGHDMGSRTIFTEIAARAELKKILPGDVLLTLAGRDIPRQADGETLSKFIKSDGDAAFVRARLWRFQPEVEGGREILVAYDDVHASVRFGLMAFATAALTAEGALDLDGMFVVLEGSVLTGPAALADPGAAPAAPLFQVGDVVIGIDHLPLRRDLQPNEFCYMYRRACEKALQYQRDRDHDMFEELPAGPRAAAPRGDFICCCVRPLMPLF
ncbi:hypothetical protein M885DRAFT_558665 [Pelagophyceae sp. CCMP2097]|nr:hypothetical protein M885DRAFT_558665 [Pelagophyceae sp. CCMP2097]